MNPVAMRQWKHSAASAERANISRGAGRSGTAVLRCRVAVLPAVAAVLLMLAAFWRLRRTWPDAAQPAALALPLAVALAGTLGPEPAAAKDRAAVLAALRADPYRLPDPHRHATVFHLIAWPVALVVGDGHAVRLVAAVAAAGAWLLAHALFRSAGLAPRASLIGQAALGVLPVLALGPGPALVTHALPQALELLLLAHLVRRLGHLEGARDNAGAFTYLLLAQAATPATTLEVGLLAVLLALVLAASGARRRALRLATCWALAAAVVLVARYGPLALDGAAGTVRVPPERATGTLALAMAATLCGAFALWLLPRHTPAPLVLGTAMVAGWVTVAAGVAGFEPGVAPGLGLLAPVSAAGLASVAARITSPKSGATPGSRT
jgi:hypothetical protein